MKKLLVLLFVAVLSATSFAKGEYVIYYNEVDNKEQFQDSIVNINVDLIDSDMLLIRIGNRTDSRITVEWENAMIDGAHVAFSSDYVYQSNMTKQDEVITSWSAAVKTIMKRYSSVVPIFDKKKVKKGGTDYFYLTIPIRVGDKSIDYSLRYYIKYVKE